MVITVTKAELLIFKPTKAKIISVEVEIDNRGSIPLSVRSQDFSLLNARGKTLRASDAETLSLAAGEKTSQFYGWDIPSSWFNGAGYIKLVYGPTAWTTNKVKVDLTARVLGSAK